MSDFTLSNLNDYLEPAQDCVGIPMKPQPKEESKSIKIAMENDLEGIEGGEKADIIKSKGDVATISLADCLACSGCVTTAETMLIQ